MSNFLIPRFYSGQPSNLNDQFLLLNNEISFDTYLFGFELLASNEGSLNIQAMIFKYLFLIRIFLFILFCAVIFF